MALNGSETLQVQGQDAKGNPAATTQQVTTGQVAALAGANPNAATTVNASATAAIGGKYNLSAASGSTLTLPNATGSGGTIRVYVGTTVTSNAHKILAGRSQDNMQGNALANVAGTITGFNAAISQTFHSLQLNGGTTGGFQGDYFELTDLAANVWQVNAVTKATATAATPFSTATS